MLMEAGRKAGHACSQPVQFIAATAAHRGLTVVTRDTREYEYVRVPVLDPWK